MNNMEELNNKIKDSLANKLRIERAICNVKLSDIAKETGIGISCLSRYENGESIPDAINLAKLSHYFQVSADYLLGTSENKRILTHSKLMSLQAQCRLLISDLEQISREDLNMRLAQDRSMECYKDYREKDNKLCYVEFMTNKMINEEEQEKARVEKEKQEPAIAFNEKDL